MGFHFNPPALLFFVAQSDPRSATAARLVQRAAVRRSTYDFCSGSFPAMFRGPRAAPSRNEPFEEGTA
jgi:hypothetical protein